MANGDLERKYWARAWAKALREAGTDPSFKVKLETDPLLAYRQIRGQFGGPLPHPVIPNIEFYEDDIFAQGETKFSQMTAAQLLAIIMNGKRVPYNELKKIP